ncbi:enoyl-CoA hydratase/isomerase family protein [Rhodococcus sp. IEGM 1366]|uniref:enoyl-CoA hydratase/isomerase family protein n=1 Tax=Rhodococcus sp. IEGM 1366 TaxID=3082223 RepID=UPI0029552EDE|nr:enoyl-CoA hydratase/isomerase family protein [Rhodococcus sp. IEGM 1366]MDV8071022.1 enoyl-CoA hydratase/isomerase family protein [Rhodococcus sp. IEGM 1366]
MNSKYHGLIVERHGPVGWLIFDRPSVGNAMDAAMLADLSRAWRDLDDDPQVSVIVNTGNGRAFQTGLDILQLAREPDALLEQSRRTKRADVRLSAWHNNVATPVIAAINGVCAGGGLHFVADADIVIAAETASFVDPHTSVGQASVFELIGLARRGAVEPVMRLGLLGGHQRLSAARAFELGIISEVVSPPERLREAAQMLGEQIAQTPRDVLRAIKSGLWQALETDLTEARRATASSGGTRRPRPIPK